MIIYFKCTNPVIFSLSSHNYMPMWCKHDQKKHDFPTLHVQTRPEFSILCMDVSKNGGTPKTPQNDHL